MFLLSAYSTLPHPIPPGHYAPGQHPLLSDPLGVLGSNTTLELLRTHYLDRGQHTKAAEVEQAHRRYIKQVVDATRRGERPPLQEGRHIRTLDEAYLTLLCHVATLFQAVSRGRAVRWGSECVRAAWREQEGSAHSNRGTACGRRASSTATMQLSARPVCLC